tara:strand:+ start:64 stop:315 length:252 start_codon:yes stop_codon:yes gene_type:complete
MATGDVTVSVAIAGGVTKTVTLTSATRIKAKLLNDDANASDLSNDATWAAFAVNELAAVITQDANDRLRNEASWTPIKFTAAT